MEAFRIGRGDPPNRKMMQNVQLFRRLISPSCLLTLFFCFPTSSFAEELQATRQDLAKGVVQLLAIGPGARDTKQECAATGFLVSGEGYILTNAHVVEDARRCLASSPGAKILAKFGAGEERTAQGLACDVFALDDDHDLAVLKTEKPLPWELKDAFLRLAPDPVPDGARVMVTGYPSFAWQQKNFRGRVVARQSLPLGDAGPSATEVLVLNITLQRGASGSPVYLESGEVVGIVERQRPSNRLETLAVPTTQAIFLLDRLGIGRGSSHDEHPLELRNPPQ